MGTVIKTIAALLLIGVVSCLGIGVYHVYDANQQTIEQVDQLRTAILEVHKMSLDRDMDLLKMHQVEPMPLIIPELPELPQEAHYNGQDL